MKLEGDGAPPPHPSVVPLVASVALNLVAVALFLGAAWMRSEHPFALPHWMWGSCYGWSLAFVLIPTLVSGAALALACSYRGRTGTSRAIGSISWVAFLAWALLPLANRVSHTCIP